MSRDQARKRAWLLYRSLEKITEQDPGQEVRGIAIPVLEACLQSFREHVPDDPIVAAIREVLSPRAIATGEPLRAVDVMLVAGQLAQALGDEKPVMAPQSVRSSGPSIADMQF